MAFVPFRSLALAAGLASLAGCASSTSGTGSASTAPVAGDTAPPSPDPRIGLRAGRQDAAEATWNLRVVSKTPPPARFAEATSSDLAFLGNYAIQGNYNGVLIWDISNPAQPTLTTEIFCPASQNDVSVHKNLLFVSTEG